MLLNYQSFFFHLLQLLLYRINNLFQHLLLVIFFPEFFSFPKWGFLTLPIKSIHTMAVSIPQHPSQALSLHQFSNSLNFIFEFLQLLLSFFTGEEPCFPIFYVNANNVWDMNTVFITLYEPPSL